MKAELAHSRWEMRESARWRAQWEQRREYVAQIRAATGVRRPEAYCGIGRDAVDTYFWENEREIERQRRLGEPDVDWERAARTRLGEIAKGYGDDMYYGNLLASVSEALEVCSLLESPDAYEVIQLRRADKTTGSPNLGYDVGFLAVAAQGDTSVLADCTVRPTWHAPDPADLPELSNATNGLNEHGLFLTAVDAERFLGWYRAKPWAEEVIHEILVIRVDLVD